MTEKTKSSEPRTESQATPGKSPEAAARNIPSPNLAMSAERVKASYANLARATSTPEEVVLDLALNLNAFGQVTGEEVQVDHRVVMSYPTAKRLLALLGEIIRRHESQFGPIETDVKRRVIRSN